MGKPNSLDLRERIVGYVEEGHSARAAAGVFGVSASTAVVLRQPSGAMATLRPSRRDARRG